MGVDECSARRSTAPAGKRKPGRGPLEGSTRATGPPSLRPSGGATVPSGEGSVCSLGPCSSPGGEHWRLGNGSCSSGSRIPGPGHHQGRVTVLLPGGVAEPGPLSDRLLRRIRHAGKLRDRRVPEVSDSQTGHAFPTRGGRRTVGP